MALAYDAARVTRDVGSLFVPHGVVLEEARNVAQELGLPPWWLNEQASVYISGKDDPGKRRVFDHPGLRVTAASPSEVCRRPPRALRLTRMAITVNRDPPNCSTAYLRPLRQRSQPWQRDIGCSFDQMG
jgi:hypothetical protein